MLDSETKRQIDSCRDILVGKVPNPQAQVEQITIALIYKFMDDMDAEAVELGGKRSFFVGEFAKYAWTKLMAPKMGGHDVLALYSEAITRMNQNKGIPPLFREIFKNAFLPYRDPETLRLFLKEIHHFHYSHSEKLGDAFEYLLSVLGSQGDAGQFRTPRHIIDFMVEVMDPKKNETILDPACGTAGFLISSYKHILKSNTKKRPGDLLTADERSRLAKNIQGYDISPDMVRLSLVNLYLHGFANPRIEEYDTLTSDDKWNELSDLILANPPFMSPKGGIKPHKRFSVQASKSEVLFVDYMAEHLTPNGRAAIVVPEGIIFQSGTAYKQLREMLVKNSLVAVVSLPAGVFNPYSGVKTSILILDKRLSKKSDTVLFVKVENDGFGLGAQRRAVENSDLPKTVEILHKWLGGKKLKDGEGLVVEKSRIGENGEWNLSGERYQSSIASSSSWPMVSLEKVISLASGSFLPAKDMVDGPYSVYGGNGINGKHNSFTNENSTIVIGRVGAYCGAVHLTTPKSWITDNALYVKSHNDSIDLAFLMHALVKINLNQYAKVGGQPSISQSIVLEREIPLPPLDVQKQIVAEIEGYQKIIDGARLVVENYKPQIEIDPEWPVVELGDAFTVISGFSFDSKDFSAKNPVKCIKITNVGVNEFLTEETGNVPYEYLEKYSAFSVLSGDVVVSLTRPIISTGLKIAVVPESWSKSLVNQRVAGIKASKKQSMEYLFSYLSSKDVYRYVEEKSRSLMQPNLSINDLKSLQIPLPPLDVQRAIVSRIEQEQALVNSNKELIRIFEEKIKKTIDRVWGE